MVLTARRLRWGVVDDGEKEAPTVTARTASATASSSREGSKKMLSLTAMTRRVIGGRVRKGFDDWASVLVLVLVLVLLLLMLGDGW